MLKATEWEFRNRFWLFGAIFWVGFGLYAIDHVNVVELLIDRSVGHDSPNDMLVARLAFGFGALLMLLAALIRTWGGSYLRAIVVHDANLHSEKVVADGPYRHVRNPLYLGNLLMACSFALMASRSGAVVLVAGMTIFCLRLIGLEEAQLEREQGEGYLRYRDRVPRLIPSIAPRLPASGAEPQWKQAFGGEIFVWAFFLGVLAFVITLKIWTTWLMVALGLGIYIVRAYTTVGKKKTAQAP
jgi:protein-S-isoprenylcysteine O-methyltransferase Ste14